MHILIWDAHTRTGHNIEPYAYGTSHTRMGRYTHMGQNTAIVSEFQILLTRMVNSYEQEGIREHVLDVVAAVFHPAKPAGRPAIDIPGEQLRFLVENGFKITDMAQMFGCSCRTISRRLKEFNIEYNVYTDINDRQLDEIVSDIAARLPCCGIRSMQSMLRANGFTLQRERVATSCRSSWNARQASK